MNHLCASWPNMTMPAAGEKETTTRPELRALLLYFLGLGTFGFGGPIALVGYMRRDLVEKRKWVRARIIWRVSRFRSCVPDRSRDSLRNI
jgi:Chromate transporter